MSLDDVLDIYPLSPMQAGMLFHTIDEPDSGIYVLQIRVLLTGPLNPDVLRAAWDEVVHRHDAVRAAFVWEDLDEPLQAIKNRVETPWTQLDGRRLVAEGGPDAIEAWLARDRRTGFDLKDAPLMRVTLIELEEDLHRFVWTLHHLLADAWSVAVVLDELQIAYHARLAGETFSPGDAPAYRDFIAWLRSRDVERSKPAWRRHLEGFSERTRMDLVRPTAASADRRTRETRLPARAADALAEVTRRSRVTQTAIFKAAWASVLSGYAGATDIVFGLVVSGRAHDLAGGERAVGLYMNTIPSRVRLDAAPTLRGLIQSIHRDSLDLRPHENTPLGRIQSWSDLPAGAALFDTLLIIENHPTPSARSQALSFGAVDPMDQSNYPLAAFVIPGDELRLLILFDPTVVPDGVADRLLAQFAQALEAIPSYLDSPPSVLPVLPDAERAQLDELAYGPRLAPPEDVAVHHRIVRTARQRPEARALVGGGDSMTYGELDSRSSALARRLAALGVDRGDRVALQLDRGCDMVVAMLATMKAGGAYVPLDPTYPAARIRQVLEDCAPSVVVTNRASDSSAEAAAVRTLNLDDADDDRGIRSFEGPMVVGADPAYVIYTSGSTGQPKGVVITHDNLAFSTNARFAFYDDAPQTYLLLSSFAFDSSVAGIYWTLACGGTLVISEPGLERDVDGLSDCIATHAVSHTLCLPSLWDVLLELAPAHRLATLRTVIVAGEAVPSGLSARHRAVLPDTALFNEYGPTEACVWCSVADSGDLDAAAASPVGRPIPGAEVRLLTADQRPAPLGAVGEIWIGGPGVAEGYLGQTEATALSFAQPAGTDRRMYRSGDLGRYLPDGGIDFLGRRDRQVKIRGHRIETTEIEEVLHRHPGVREATVIAVPSAAAASGTTEDRRLALAAFVTPAEADGGPSPDELRHHVRARLPAFMAPARIFVVDEFPRLPNGKTDHDALLLALTDTTTSDDRSPKPRDDFERALVEVWGRVLEVEELGIHDDFFAFGGDSIASIRIVALAQQRDIEIAPSEIFEFPTIAELSDNRLMERSADAPVGGRVMRSEQRVTGQGAPLFMVHGGRRMLKQLTERLSSARPVHLLVDHRDAGDVAPFASIGSLADDYLAAIRELQREPPRFIGGYSIGAPIAVEMARRLQLNGHEPSLVFLLDPPDDPARFKSAAGFVAAPSTGARSSEGGGPDHSPTRVLEIAIGAGFRALGLDAPLRVRRRYVPWVYDRALRRHPLGPYTGRMLIFHSSDAKRNAEGRTLWQFLEPESAETVCFDAAHTEFVRDPEVVDEWTRCLAEHLAALDPEALSKDPTD
jgi:amino acid adenylation domain-containing protein